MRVQDSVDNSIGDLFTLQVGSVFNEEGVFYNKPSPYDIVAISENVNTYTIKRADIYNVLTEE